MKIKNTCTHDKTFPARMRGSKVRYQCESCGHLGKWTRNTGSLPVIEQAKAVERGDLPSGSVVVKVTGANSMHTAAQSEHNDLDALTVDELRRRAKDGGVKGYSKMRKSELITVLVAGLPTR